MAQAWPARPPRIASGTVTANGTTLTAVAFPAGLFTAPPVVVATVVGSRVPVTVQAISETGFSTIHNGSGNLPVAWVATQP